MQTLEKSLFQYWILELQNLQIQHAPVFKGYNKTFIFNTLNFLINSTMKIPTKKNDHLLK